MIKILQCGCDGNLGNKRAAHFQDERYGKGMRVHNPMSSKEGSFRCSVCNHEVVKKEEKKKQDSDEAPAKDKKGGKAA